MDVSELNSLDFENVGDWPVAIKIGSAVLLCLLMLGGVYWFDTKEQLAMLQVEQKKETELKQTLRVKQTKVANLEIYKRQLEEMKRSFGALIRQLPNRTEVAELLVDVSQTGLANGLEFDLFQPIEEQPKDFYAELPIKLKVIGHFHEFGMFVSGLAALPRIVTLHDIQIRDAKAADDEVKLLMEATAKTYRYLDEDE